MKLAITGKGGVGKTTLSALLARLYASEGNAVMAIDANPDANLASALGISAEEAKRITPIAEMKDLIEERTGAKPGSGAPFFKLNPTVDDIPERFSARIDGVKLLIMGTVKTGGGGCMCPEGALVRSLLAHLLFREKDVVIMDMDAGMEHLGRGTAQSVDAFIAVVEPGMRSVHTAEAIRNLAKDLGVKSCYVVGSKTRSDADRQFIIDNTSQFELLGFIDYNPKIAEADLKGMSVFDADSGVVDAVRKIKQRLESIPKEDAQ